MICGSCTNAGGTEAAGALVFDATGAPVYGGGAGLDVDPGCGCPTVGGVRLGWLVLVFVAGYLWGRA